MPPGMGIIDWNGFVRALKEVGYNGYLSFELGDYKDPDRYVKQAKEYMMRILEEENALG
jgi:protein FrlC